MRPELLHPSNDPPEVPGEDSLSCGDSAFDHFLRELARVSDTLSFEGSTEEGPGEWSLPELPGRFTVLRVLGSGGFGTVYAVRDQVREADVALKLLRRRDARSLYAFKQEFRALAALDHPNLLRLFEFFAIGELWCFTLELLDGVDVVTHVRGVEGPERERRLRDVLAQLLEGLVYLHARGLLHRDLKPSNLRVTAEGRLVVLDFGLVTPAAEGATEGGHSLAGTRTHMAPELLRGGSVGPAADLYAVGVVLYELLTGDLPPPGALEARAALSHAPPDLAGLCLELLSASPASRPPAHLLRERLSLSGGSAPTREAGFIGREAELEALDEALGATRRGVPVWVLVQGSSGSGKTVLLQQFIQEQRRRRPELLVLSGRCFAQVSMPHEAIDGVVDDLYRHLLGHPEEVPPPPELESLSRLFPVLRRLGRTSTGSTPAPEEELSELRPRAAAALASLLTRLAGHRPLALLVDDFQWADLDSARLLLELGGPRAPPLLWVVAVRSEDAEASPALASLREALGGEVRTLELGGLEPEQAEQLARSLGADGPGARRIARDSWGNPFLLTELCRHLEGARSEGPGTSGASASVAELLRARVSVLPAEARQLLGVVSVAGYPLERSLAARAAWPPGPARLPEPELVRALVASHLVRIQRLRGEELLAPYHHRIGELVSGELSPEERREGHRGIARALVAVGASAPGRLLLHLRAAGDGAGAARYALEAARHAREALAFERAAELYTVALELGSPGGATVDEVEEERAEVLRAAGHPREAAEAFLRAASLAPGDRRTSRLRQQAMEQLLLAGHVARGLELLHGLQAELGLGDIPLRLGPWQRLRLARAVARVRRARPGARAVDEEAALRADVCRTAAQAMLYVEPHRAAGFHLRHLELAPLAAEPERLLQALSLDAALGALGGHRARCRANLAAIERIDAAQGGPRSRWGAAFAEGLSAMVQGEWRHASERLAQCEELFRRQGWRGGIDLDRVYLQRANCDWMRGDIPALMTRVEALERQAERGGNRLSSALLGLTSGFLVHLCRDEPGRAWAEIERSAATADALAGGLQRHTRLTAELRVLLYEGRGEEAWARLAAADRRGGGDLFERSPLLRGQLGYLRGAVALGAGRLEAAARACRWLRWRAPRWAIPHGLLLEACLLWRHGRRELARRRFAEAEEGFSRGAQELFVQVARWRGGQCAAEAGREQRQEAEAWLRARGVRAPASMVAMLAPVPWAREATPAGPPDVPAAEGAS